MIKSVSSIYRFTTTLQILARNRNQLKTINKNVIPYSHPTKSKTNLLPYYGMNFQYIKSNSLKLSNHFKQLQVFRNKLLPNLALANGEDYQEYPLPKIIHICLKNIQQQNQNQQIWKKLEKRVSFLLRNTSALDNILLYYVSINKFSIELQDKLLKLIQQQIKFLTQLERQFLYYSLCHLRDKTTNNPNLSRLNKLREDLAQTVQRSKINMGILIQWIVLVSITNASTQWTMMKYYEKIHLYSKYILTPDQFISLLKCLEYRSILATFEDNRQIKSKGRQLIDLFKSTVPNYEMLLSTSNQERRAKMMLSYYYPNSVDYQLSVQEITNSNLTSAEKLKYLHWLWKNDFKQLYELKSVYQSIQPQINLIEMDSKPNFSNIDILYYISWLQMGLKDFKHYQYVVNAASSLEYIPRGLQMPIWNYLVQITKNNLLGFENAKENVQLIVNKIQKVSQTRNKEKFISEEINRVKKNNDIQQIQKFLHSIKAWAFKSFEPIAPIDYIGHFVSHDMKIILHCLTQPNLTQSELKQINSEHTLTKIMLQQNLGYSVVDINVKEFLEMNYNDRIQWLQQKTNEFSKVVGKISQK